MTTGLQHACAISVEGKGILIAGPSGVGKSSLMFGLVERLIRNNLEARIISDDQTRLQALDGKLIASAPGEIARKAELRGFGLVEVDITGSTELVLAVRLIEDAAVERMPEEKFHEFLGVRLPLLEVPTRHEEAASRIVMAWIRDNLSLNLPFPCA